MSIKARLHPAARAFELLRQIVFGHKPHNRQRLALLLAAALAPRCRVLLAVHVEDNDGKTGGGRGGIVMSGRRPLIKGFFAALRLIVGAVMSSAC